MNTTELNWEKMDGLLPVIVQHANTGCVLTLAYMNQDALAETLSSGELTLFSRSRQTRWRKGETSGNRMLVQNISADCDQDSLLVQVLPTGPACHLGSDSCFPGQTQPDLVFLASLIALVSDRAARGNSNSYTAQLLNEGVDRCAQKVGEEAVETVIAAVTGKRADLINESADLLFHLLVLLQACELGFDELLACLRQRSLLGTAQGSPGNIGGNADQ